MSSIFGGLQNVLNALQAQQYALDVTQRNVSNVNTAGYSRLRVSFTPGGDDTGGLRWASAPSVSVESFRDRFIDYRIAQELPGRGGFDTISQALQQIDGILNAQDGNDLQTALSDFFNGFSALANAPDDLALRQNVLAAATRLTNQFHRIYSRIQSVQLSQDRAVSDTVTDINSVTRQIAALNARVSAAQAVHSADESSLRDQRQLLLDQLSGLADVTYFETESGAVTVTSGQGDALVVADQSWDLQATTIAGESMTRIVLEGKDVTSSFQAGKLGGLIQVRDQQIASYLTSLDDLAAGLIERVNAQHALGSDLEGNDGGDFFTPFTPPWPGNNQGAASSISLAISDPKLIAAAERGAGPGSNANAQIIAAIKDEALFLPDDFTISQFYAGLVSAVGLDYKAADDGLNTQDQLLLQLQNQRDSLAGVNLDEEAVNLVKFQKAYEASARLAQVWNTLADEVINLLGT